MTNVIPFPIAEPVPPEAPGAETINALFDVTVQLAARIGTLTEECDRMKAEAAALADHAEEQRLFINEIVSRIAPWPRIFWPGFMLGFCVAVFIGIVMVLG